MIGTIVRTSLIAALLVSSLTAQAATSDQKQAAQRAYAEGKRYYDVGDWTDALAAFKRAYLAYEEPTFLFNMAQCHRQLGNKAEAIKIYRSYLRNSNGEAPNSVEVKRIIAELEASLRADQAAAEARERASHTPPEETSPPGGLTSSSGTTSATTLTASRPADAPKKSKLWVLGVVGGIAAAGLAVGLGVGLTVGRPTEQALMKVQF